MALPLLFLCFTMSLVSLEGFPHGEDAYLILILKELGVSGIDVHMADRFLGRHLWTAIASASGKHLWVVGGILHLLLWLVLGLLVLRLSRWVIRDRGLRALAACLTVAPLAPDPYHFNVVTIPWTALLTVVIAWLGVVLLLDWIHEPARWRLPVGAVLLGLAVLYSQYGVPVAMTGLALLLGLPGIVERRRRVFAAAGIAVVVIFCYLVYVQIGKSGFRPSVDPLHRSPNPLGLILGTATMAWKTTVSRVAEAAAAVSFDHESLSNLAGVVLGLLLAALLVLSSRPGKRVAPRSEPTADGDPIPVAAFAAALVIGLAPTVFMRGAVLEGLQARFVLGSLPVAATLLCMLVERTARNAGRTLFLVFCGLVISFSTITAGSRALRHLREMDEAGVLLRPLVEREPGLVIGVSDLCRSGGHSCTGQIARQWPARTSQKLWMLSPAQGEALLGRRQASPVTRVVDTGTLTLPRKGTISRAVVVRSMDGETVLEPYWSQ